MASDAMEDAMQMQEPHLWRRLEIATAAGGAIMVAFWAAYFFANDALGLVEPAYAPFEESFIVADTVLAVLLFAAALSLHRHDTAGPFLLAMAAAMCLYLGILDATFYARNGMFSPLGSGALMELLVNTFCIGGGLYGLRAAWRMWRAA
jgi:hypothetical protein